MNTKNKNQLVGIAASLLLFVLTAMMPASMASVGTSKGQKVEAKDLSEKVRHEIIMLSDFGVFDNLNFTLVNGDTVILTGQVVRPLLKADAETAVSRIPGIAKVENKIEVLPLSPTDDAIRLRTYRAIYSAPNFEKYAIQAVPPIRIIVKNSTITLQGVVNDQMDKTKANMEARQIPGIFSVTDNLRIQ
jgi:hypothetical protein